MTITDVDKGRARARRSSLATSWLALALVAVAMIAVGPASRAQPPTLPPPGHCVAPPPDMVAWYPLDGNGNDLILGKNATAVGTVGYPGAVVQRGGQLTTDASYFSIAPGPVLNQGLGDFSIDLWLYVPPQWHDVPAPHRTLIDKRTSDGSGSVRGYALYLIYRRLGIQLGDGNYSNFGSKDELATGWNHVAVSVDRDNPQGIVFYRNGAPNGIENPTARQGNLDNGSPTLLGRNVFGHDLRSTGAVLDEIEFFDRVLQPTEVKMIFAAGPAGKCKG